MASQIKTTMMDVEFPLVKSELDAIDVRLLGAETTLFWSSEGARAVCAAPRVKLGGRGGGGRPPSVCPDP